ncbi:biotin transporter BioY [Bacillus vallismortis]|nr:biotin transporter BioY [Bacillus vallismortis]MCI4137560.1 biotin transporter BioY [Bacillus vallismortis]MCY7892828.1 biotin transporter BioY [Bacillus vallismortis]MCY7917292.1 biotin transporter BioY [Bacillus vallismortis]
MKTKDMVLSALFAAIIAALGLLPPIPLPFSPVPITVQTLGVMLAGSFLGKKLGGLSALLVVIISSVGAPILAGGRGGFSVLAGPTGGFLLSWPIAAFIIGYLTELFWKRLNVWKLFLINVLGGVLLINIIGTPYMSFITKMPLWSAAVANIAFVPGDVIKALVTAFICMKVIKVSPIHEKKGPQQIRNNQSINL